MKLYSFTPASELVDSTSCLIHRDDAFAIDVGHIGTGQIIQEGSPSTSTATVEFAISELMTTFTLVAKNGNSI